MADAEHLWWTEKRNAGSAIGGGAALRGVSLNARGAWRNGIRTTTEIRDTLRYANGRYQSANHSIQLAGPLGTAEAVLPIDPYALGVWLGDGDSDSPRLTVGESDTEIVEHLAAVGVKASSSIDPIRYGLSFPDAATCGRGHRPEWGRNGTHCLACERETDHARRHGQPVPPRTILGLRESLRMGNLLNNKHIPSAYLRASVSQRLSLLQGLMDTDGYISPESGACEFCSTDEHLANGAHELVLSLGVKTSFKESAAKLYGREVSRRWRLQFHPPADVPVFRLRRKLKHQIVRHARRRLSGDRRITAVVPVESVPVRCIAVNSPSHLYLAGRSMIPTHNTPLLAGCGLYGLAFDNEASAEVYVAAFDRGQADILLRDAIRMATDSPDFAALLDIGKFNIAHLESGSFFRSVSSEHRSKSGPRPSLVLIDEEHEHRDGTVIAKMVAGFKGRVQPLALRITNSGSDKTSICWEHHEHSLHVLDGTIADEQWFAYVCQLDPCETCYHEGYREPKDGCPACDDWTDPQVWPKTNPSLSIGLPRQSYLESQVETAQARPSEQALVKRLNFCIWTQAHTIWIPPDRWEACRVPTVSAQNHLRACALGFDMSEKLDLTAGVVALRVDDDQETGSDTVELVEVVGEHEVKKTLNLNFCVELIPFFWLPEETLIQRVTKERIPFDVWARTPSPSTPSLRVTPGPVVDHDLIYDQVMTEIVPTWKPQRIGYDPWNATQFALALRDRGKQMIVEVQQGRALSETIKLFEALVRLKRIRHAGNPVLGWCLANAEPSYDRWRNVSLAKPSGIKRIDGIIAALIALSQLVLLPAKVRRKPRGALLYVPGQDHFVPAFPPPEAQP